MPEQNIITKPEIFAFSPEDTAVVMSAKRLQNAMYRDPETYIDALTTDKSAAKVRKAGETIQTLISNGALQEMYFDEGTEAVIAHDPRHEELLKERKNISHAAYGSYKISESTQQHAEQKREKLRDDMIKNRYAIFAGRIVTWQVMTGSRPSGDPAAANPKLRHAV